MTARISLLLALLALLFVQSSIGQEENSATGEIPRMTDGRPDMRGIWQTLNTAIWDVLAHPAQLGVPAGRGVVEGNVLPYLESAIEKREENYRNRESEDPEANCFMVGVPRITYMPYPFQIMQTGEQLTILYEYVHTFRNIHIDSEHPEGPIQWWMGDSRGYWEGDTLVVDVIHFTDKTWFDRSGNYHSDALHVIERYTPLDPDHILYEATIEDPKVYSRPWKMSMPLYRHKEEDARILEYECYALLEEERDAARP